MKNIVVGFILFFFTLAAIAHIVNKETIQQFFYFVFVVLSVTTVFAIPTVGFIKLIPNEE